MRVEKYHNLVVLEGKAVCPMTKKSLKYITVEWVSEWLLFNTNSAIFQRYHGENKLIFNEMMMRSALY